jgi:hypothetical protein
VPFEVEKCIKIGCFFPSFLPKFHTSFNDLRIVSGTYNILNFKSGSTTYRVHWVAFVLVLHRVLLRFLAGLKSYLHLLFVLLALLLNRICNWLSGSERIVAVWPTLHTITAWGVILVGPWSTLLMTMCFILVLLILLIVILFIFFIFRMCLILRAWIIHGRRGARLSTLSREMQGSTGCCMLGTLFRTIASTWNLFKTQIWRGQVRWRCCIIR